MQIIPLEIQGAAAIPLTIEDGGAVIPLGISQAGGTNDYNRLINKPSINDMELIGNKSFTDLHLDAITPQQIDDIIFGGI